MSTPGKLKVDTATGHVTGPADLHYNAPFPTPNGRYGSGAMMGLVVHTQVGNNPGTVEWFNNPQSQASAHFCVAQDGSVVQMGPIGKGWIAWAEADGNPEWYSVEFADDGNPANPLTPQQITAGAQILECLSGFAGFPLQISDSPSVKGLGWHGMGGQAWGGHFDCPGNVRKAQRPQIVALAMSIRQGAPPAPKGPYRHTVTAGQTLEEIAASRSTTAEHLFAVSASAYTAADVALLAKVPLPAGTPYYTSNPLRRCPRLGVAVPVVLFMSHLVLWRTILNEYRADRKYQQGSEEQPEGPGWQGEADQRREGAGQGPNGLP